LIYVVFKPDCGFSWMNVYPISCIVHFRWYFAIFVNLLLKWNVQENLFCFVKCLFYSSYLSITHVQIFFVSLFTSFVEISMLFEALLNKSIGSKWLLPYTIFKTMFPFSSLIHHYLTVVFIHAWIEHYIFFDTQHIAIKSPHNPPSIANFWHLLNITLFIICLFMVQIV